MFVFDFDKAKDGTVKTVNVAPDGWKTPLQVEYCLAQVNPYDTQLSVVWRVRGTVHCFTIYEQKLNVVSNADYKKHFEEILRNFRFDYWTWFHDEKYENAMWKYDYEKQYGNLILPERKQDHFSDCK